MKLTKPALYTFAVLLILWLVPTALTYDAPYVDGARLHGFPLPFYWWGGLCAGGKVCMEFSQLFLLIDLVVLLGIPALVNYFVLRRRNLTNKS